MDTRQATAKNIDQARKLAGLSIEDVAATIGAAYTTTHRKLNGQTPINVEEVAAIAKVLGVPADSLVVIIEDAA
jgi:transcriptional regulator with XRE-family HTH domain